MKMKIWDKFQRDCTPTTRKTEEFINQYLNNWGVKFEEITVITVERKLLTVDYVRMRFFQLI